MESLRALDLSLWSEFRLLPSQEQVFWILNGGRKFMRNTGDNTEEERSATQIRTLKLCAQFICRIDTHINSPVGPPEIQGETSSMLVPGKVCSLLTQD